MFHPQGPTFWELTHQALSSTQRGYDLLAPKFDFTPFRTPDFLLEPVADLIASLGPHGLGLDVCCGTGAAMKMLRPLCQQAVIGVDFSEPMLRVAQQQVELAPGSARPEFVHGDVLRIPFQDAFDIAVCFGALGHILPAQQRLFVEQIKQALRAGGIFVFATSEMPPWYAGRYWLARAFNGAMHVRNWLVQPPFVMFYLTFLLSEATAILTQAGFEVEVRRAVFPVPFQAMSVVIATKPRPQANKTP